MVEAILQKHCEDFLAMKGLNYLHLPKTISYKNKAFSYLKGFPDIVVFTQRTPIFIELKVKGGDMSDEQIEWKYQLEKQGYLYYVAWCIEEFVDIIQEHT